MIEKLDKTAVINQPNKILEFELGGVKHYTQSAFLIFGYSRIPIIEWMEKQATQSLQHAKKAGELIVSLGGKPALEIGPLIETHNSDLINILQQSLCHERDATSTYKDLLELVNNRSEQLEHYSKRLISQDEVHQDEVNMLLNNPVNFKTFSLLSD
jgi:bacterioferritin